jgi:hypothetical protein
LWNAAWIVVGTMMTGAVTSGRASRAVCTASKIDSVPPDVTVPTTWSSPCTSGRAKATRSRSIDSRLGNAVGSSPLVEPYIASAARPTSSASARPES